jgi:hypothetical protein
MSKGSRRLPEEVIERIVKMWWHETYLCFDLTYRSLTRTSRAFQHITLSVCYCVVHMSRDSCRAHMLDNEMVSFTVVSERGGPYQL